MADDSRLELVERFFRGTGSTYDLVVNVATFGIDRLWKRRIVSLIPPHAQRILDLACGTGISTAAIARRFPNARIVGVELRDDGVLVMYDFIYPPKRALVAIWRLYFKALQTIGGVLLPSWREIYYGLPELIERSHWLRELQALLMQHRFRDIRVQYLTAYGSAIVSARK